MPIGFTRLQATDYRPSLKAAKTAGTADPQSQPSLQITHADEVCFSGGQKKEAPAENGGLFSPRRLLSRLLDLLFSPVHLPLAKFGFGNSSRATAAPIALHRPTTDKSENPFSTTVPETPETLETTKATPESVSQTVASDFPADKTAQAKGIKFGNAAFQSIQRPLDQYKWPGNQPYNTTPYRRVLYPGIPSIQHPPQRFWNAVSAGQAKRVREFIAKGIDVNCPQPNGETALHVASTRGSLPVVLALLESPDINVNAADHRGTRPIHKAVIENHPDIVDALVGKGAELEADSWYENKPLQLAANLGHEEVTRRLIQHGAAVNGQSQQGYTALYWAADQRHLGVVKELLAHGAKVSIPNQYGETPLHGAARGGDATIMKLMLAAEDADPNAPDKKGETPLLRAAEQDHLEALEALVAKGGDLYHKSKEGLTPMDILERRRIIRESKVLE